MPHRGLSALLLVVLLALAPACSGGRPPPEAEGADASSAGTLSGSSHLSGATVTLYRLAQGGQRGAQVARATTAEDGTFSLPVGLSEGPFLVVLTGGSTVDAASGATVQLGSDELTALVPRFAVGTHQEKLRVSPVSHFAAGLALREVQAGAAALVAADASAWHYLNGHFGGLDWRTVAPADLTATTSLQLDDSTRAGLILAGLSQQALTLAKQTGLTAGGSLNALTLTSALHEDLVADGYFDGKGQQGQRLLLPAAGVLTPHQLDGLAVRFQLAAAVRAFLANERNAFRVTPADVQPLLTGLSRSSSPRLFREAGVEFDAQPPTVTVHVAYKDSSGAVVPAATTTRPFVRGVVHLTVDAQDDAGVTALKVTQLGAALTPAPRGNTTSHYLGSWDASLLADGELVFTVEAEDGRGNKGTTTVPVLLDNTPPRITRTLPAESVYSTLVRVEASAADSGSGVASLQASGLSGFSDDADSLSFLAGQWPVPASQPEGPVRLGLMACDAVSNCASEALTFTVDRTPPSVALVSSPPRYTAAEKVDFTVEASDAASEVTAVRAQRVGASGSFTATAVPGSSGRRFTFTGLPLSPGLNSFQVWAEDALHSATTSEPLLVTVSRDNTGTRPGLTPVPGYRDERFLTVERNADDTPRRPVRYTWLSSAAPAAVSGTVYKASTRLSWGASSPTGAELEGANAQNVPFLAYSAQRDYPEAQAPITAATYSIQVSCPGCSFPAYTGSLVRSPRSTATQPTYLLPLTQETVPALAQLPASPASLTLAITFTDSVGNAGTLTHSVDFHVLGPPLVVLEDNGFATRGDPNSEYAFAASNGTYAGMWGGSAPLRLARYVVHNPAPVPVRLSLATAGDWAVTEDWREAVAQPKDLGFSADGFTFRRTYNWLAYEDGGAVPTNTPAGEGGTPCGYGPGAQTAVHTAGSTVAFTCRELARPVSRELPRSIAASGPLTHAAYLPVSSGYEATPASSSNGTYEVPAEGQLVVFLVRTRGPARPLPFLDLANSRGPRIQLWHFDYWVPTSSTLQRCTIRGWPAWCEERTAFRYSTELVSAQRETTGSLRISSTAPGAEPRLFLEERFDRQVEPF